MKESQKKRVKLSVSLPSAMAEWLRKKAESDLNDVSGVVREVLLPAFRASVGKKCRGDS